MRGLSRSWSAGNCLCKGNVLYEWGAKMCFSPICGKVVYFLHRMSPKMSHKNCVDYQKCKKSEKKEKKDLTKRVESDRIWRLTRKRRSGPRSSLWRTSRFELKKLKKLEKTFQKGIDKQVTKWYNRKVDARATAN